MQVIHAANVKWFLDSRKNCDSITETHTWALKYGELLNFILCEVRTRDILCAFHDLTCFFKCERASSSEAQTSGDHFSFFCFFFFRYFSKKFLLSPDFHELC